MLTRHQEEIILNKKQDLSGKLENVKLFGMYTAEIYSFDINHINFVQGNLLLLMFVCQKIIF